MSNDFNDKEDHRKIAKDLELFLTNENIGQGLPILLPNFVFIRNKIQDFIRKQWKKYNFNEVISPILGIKKLYEKSEHLTHYKEYMFPEIEKNKEIFFLRPMTCPHHCEIFKKKPRSLRELPLRICENSNLFRYETSGSLKGLERVRCMEIADHHIFLENSEEEIKKEIKTNFLFIEEILKKLEISIDRISCSVHDPKNKEKYHSNEEFWDNSERILTETITEIKKEYVIQKNEAAFYGPKIDFEVKTKDQKYSTISTIQLDFFLPIKFNLRFIDKNNNFKTPVIIHQSPVGTYQRIIALLVEQKQGRLPLWLSSCQIVLIPINNQKSIKKETELIKKRLEKTNVRVEIWENKTVNSHIKNIHNKKIPFYIIIGKKEVKEKFFSLVDVFNKKIILIKKKDFDKKIESIFK